MGSFRVPVSLCDWKWWRNGVSFKREREGNDILCVHGWVECVKETHVPRNRPNHVKGTVPFCNLISKYIKNLFITTLSEKKNWAWFINFGLIRVLIIRNVNETLLKVKFTIYFLSSHIFTTTFYNIYTGIKVKMWGGRKSIESHTLEPP